jgi:hypothetical protein
VENLRVRIRNKIREWRDLEAWMSLAGVRRKRIEHE